MYKVNSDGCYFMRRTTLSEDEFDEEAEPVFIKIPAKMMSPPRDLCLLMGILGGYYAVDGYILIDSIEESEFEITIEPYGVMANITLLITSRFKDEDLEVITGIITPYGEFALAFFDDNIMVSPVIDKCIAKELGLTVSEEVLVAHNDFLKSIDCDDCEEKVYIPMALYGT